MNNISSDVSLWLDILSRQTTATLSVFSHEFNKLSKLAPIEVVRVIRSPSGEVRLYFIDRVRTIDILKQLYSFKTKEEITKEISMELES